MAAPASAEITRTTVTAALIYANGPVHIGHLAGCYLPADIYVRYLRSRYGEGSVLFVSGTDEHGVAITMKARKDGSTPQQVIDYYYHQIHDTFQRLGISFDVYSRTHGNPEGSEIDKLRHQLHTDTAQEFFSAFLDKVKAEFRFEVKTSEQFYDPEAQQFLADRYIVGTCPVCANPNAYGDQCERCGSTLSPDELIQPRSTLSGATPIKRPTEHWFLPLDKFEPFLRQYIDSHAGKDDTWKANVLGQCRSWLDAGLKPRAMTRDLDWGIPVPGHPGKVLYVWFDAPIGYISATKEWAIAQGKSDAWQDWWLASDKNTQPERPGTDPRLIHFIGKDNIVFHGLIFPALLHGHGDYVLPTNVAANEFLNLEGEKISTSRNWAVWAHEYLDDFAHYPQAADMLRGYLTYYAPETSDSDFSWAGEAGFKDFCNKHLVGNLGNFINRIVTLIDKHFQGHLPSYTDAELSEVLVADTTDLHTEIKLTITNWEADMTRFRFRDALLGTLRLSSLGNAYLSKYEPWKLIKENPNAAAYILARTAQLSVALGHLVGPLLPETSQKVCNLFQYNAAKGIGLDDNGNPDVAELLPAGHQLGKPELLFKKIEDADIDKQLAKLAASKADAQTVAAQSVQEANPSELSPIKPEIAFPDFEKLDLRLGLILSAQPVPKADKLLQLEIDLGLETRTILSGIAQHYTPAQLVGRRVVVVANLAPRKIKGIESRGMILMAEDTTGQLSLLQPLDDLAPGSVIR